MFELPDPSIFPFILAFSLLDLHNNKLYYLSGTFLISFVNSSSAQTLNAGQLLGQIRGLLSLYICSLSLSVILINLKA